MLRLISTVLMLCALCTSSAATDYMFGRLGTADGLSNNKVNAFLRDSSGFLWVGTASGLNRYDGYTFRHYGNIDGDSTSLADNFIESIQEDADHRLWIKSGSTYVIYNSVTDTFDRDVNRFLAGIGVPADPNIIFIAPHGAMWFYKYGHGMWRYFAGQKKAEKVSDTARWLSDHDITSIVAFGDGVVAVSKNGDFAGIGGESPMVKWTDDRISRERDTHYPAEFRAFVDRDGLMWIYSVDGLRLYDLLRRKWVDNMLPGNNGSYNDIADITQDKLGRIWIGHDHAGIEIIDKTGHTQRLVNNPTDNRSLSNNSITTLCEDADGTMWVGTYKKGISYYNESAGKFSLEDMPDVNCVVDAGPGCVWVGTNDDGLINWNYTTGARRTIADPADAGKPDAIVCMRPSRDGSLWIAPFGHGLKRLADGRFQHMSIGNDYVWAIDEDPDGVLWLGTLGSGLVEFDPATGRKTIFDTQNSGLTSDYINSMSRDADGKLYIGGSQGLDIYDPASGTFENLRGNRSGSSRFSHDLIIQVLHDSRGLVWVATREGLDVLDLKSDRLYSLPLDSDGRKAFVLGIVEDDNHDMWASSDSRLTKISVNGNPGEDLTFTTRYYGQSDGLQNCDFNQRSLHRLPGGDIVAGGLYGLNRFTPGDIHYNKKPPTVIFTGLYIFDQRVEPGKKYDGHVVLEQSLNTGRLVNLSYRQNMLTVYFATDNLVNPDLTRYEYRLIGFSDKWVECPPKLHSATYTNLQPGRYVLEVKAVNSDGYACSTPASLSIIVTPPFWATVWARIAFVVLLLCGAVAVYGMVKRRERRRWEQRRLSEEARKQEEINQLKFKFFTNVSHELRTPLTLILSPLEAMMKEPADDRAKRRLNIMYTNATRLLNLVNQLLDFRKNEVAGMALERSEGDIVAFVRNICNSFIMLSERKGITLDFKPGVDRLEMGFDEDKLGKVVMNLLGNAFKFTPDGGHVDVAVNLDGDKCLITVSDTGPGVRDDDKMRIFDRFYQSERDDMPQFTGSGIGLSLVKDFVALHGGSVRVDDRPGGGSIFVVELPVCHVASRQAEDIGHEPVRHDTAEIAATDIEPGVEPHDELPVLLAVDDNSDLIDFLDDALSDNYRVVTASNGREAMDMIKTVRPDIVLSDVMMPEMDGIELCRTLKSNSDTASIPVVMLTAKHDVRAKIEGLTMGADDYVTKPFNTDELKLRLKRLIALSRKGMRRRLIEPEPEPIEITSLDEKLVEKAVRYVEDNMSRPDLSVEELSRHLGMSRVHLYKRLRQITGKTPVEFIRVLRLKRAAQMLRQSQQNVSEIAYQLGFNSPKYFSKYFKEEYGILPSVFQEKEGV